MEDNLKNSLLGRVIKAPANEANQLDEKKIKEVLSEGAAIVSFCKSCGFVQGFSSDKAQEIADIFNINWPKSLSGLFFESEHCPLCANDFFGVIIKRYK